MGLGSCPSCGGQLGSGASIVAKCESVRFLSCVRGLPREPGCNCFIECGQCGHMATVDEWKILPPKSDILSERRTES